MADEQPPSDAGASTEVETKKLSELRVIDLKAALKKRNLDTGGNKSALTERLKRAIEEEGGNPDEIQVATDTPSKRTPKRSGRVQKHEEVDDGVEDDSGDSQENEDTSQDQENEKVLEILGENDKCEQLKEEVPKVEDSVNQEDSCVESENPKEEEVFVTIESADSPLDLDGESNQGCEDEEGKDLASDDRESKEQNTNKDTDFEMIDLDKANGQSRQTQQSLTEDLEKKEKPLGEEVTKTSEDGQEESSAIRESSSKEDDQKSSSADDEPDKSITKDEKGKIDTSSGRNLWVSGLSSTTRATDLKNLFSKYGKVVGAKVVTNARSPGARCYGFVTLSSSEDATKCINHLHRTELHGRMISVEKAKNEPAGKKPSDKKENVPKREKSSSSDRRHSTDHLGRFSPNKKIDASDKDKPTEKDKEGGRSRSSDRCRTSKSGSRGAERTVVMDNSKGEPVISVKTSSERSSKSRDRKSESREKKEILSFDKIKKQRERERQRQREREIREMERQRERDKRVRDRILMSREREERERLRRERVRLEFERDRLERERMERERLERERMRIEEERRIEQDRIQREREELRRQQDRLRYEQDRRSGVRRPYDADFRRDDSYWGESKRMALDDRYHDFGRLDRYQDFENRDRGRYMDHLHADRRDDSRSGLRGRDNYPDRHGRETREGWGQYNRHVHEGRGVPPHGRDSREWGDHGRKMDTYPSRAAPTGEGHMNRGGIHGNCPPNENSQNMSATMGPQGGGNFSGQNRPNDARFTHRY